MILFPQDFIKRNHPSLENHTQWMYYPTFAMLMMMVAKVPLPPMISVITKPELEEGKFELVDFRSASEEHPSHVLTEEEINIYLINHPIESK